MEEREEEEWSFFSSWFAPFFLCLIRVQCLYELELSPLFHHLALTSSNWAIQRHHILFLPLLHQSLNLARLYCPIQRTRQVHGFQAKIEKNTFGRFQNILHHQRCPHQDQVQGPPGDKLRNYSAKVPTCSTLSKGTKIGLQKLSTTSRQMEPSSSSSLFSSLDLTGGSIPMLVANSPIEEAASGPCWFAISPTHSLEKNSMKKGLHIYHAFTLTCEPQLGRWPKMEEGPRETSA